MQASAGVASVPVSAITPETGGQGQGVSGLRVQVKRGNRPDLQEAKKVLAELT